MINQDDEIEINPASGLPSAFHAAGRLGDHGTTYGVLADLRTEGAIEVWAVEATAKSVKPKTDGQGDTMPGGDKVWQAVIMLDRCEVTDGDYTANLPKCWNAAGDLRLALLLFVGSEHTDPTIVWPA